MSVEVKVNGGKGTVAKLQAMKRRTNQVDKAWREVGRYMAKEVNAQFRTRGLNFGTPWKPLAPATVREKKRMGLPRQPLVRTGKMKRDFTKRPLDIEKYQGHMATFGSSSKIAKFQHGGTRRAGRIHIPARKILVSTPKMRRDVRNILKKHIVKGTV